MQSLSTWLTVSTQICTQVTARSTRARLPRPCTVPSEPSATDFLTSRSCGPAYLHAGADRKTKTAITSFATNPGGDAAGEAAAAAWRIASHPVAVNPSRTDECQQHHGGLAGDQGVGRTRSHLEP